MKEEAIIASAEVNNAYLYIEEQESAFEMPIYRATISEHNDHKVIQLSGPYSEEIFDVLVNLDFVSRIETPNFQEEGSFQVTKFEGVLRKYNNNIIHMMLCSYTPDEEE